MPSQRLAALGRASSVFEPAQVAESHPRDVSSPQRQGPRLSRRHQSLLPNRSAEFRIRYHLIIVHQLLFALASGQLFFSPSINAIHDVEHDLRCKLLVAAACVSKESRSRSHPCHERWNVACFFAVSPGMTAFPRPWYLLAIPSRCYIPNSSAICRVDKLWGVLAVSPRFPAVLLGAVAQCARSKAALAYGNSACLGQNLSTSPYQRSPLHSLADAYDTIGDYSFKMQTSKVRHAYDLPSSHLPERQDRLRFARRRLQILPPPNHRE